jgi:acyl carrier protein
MADPLAEIREIVRGLLREGDTDIAPETRFDEIRGWDSMDVVTLVVEVECRFDVLFELAEIDRLWTVGDLIEMIEAKQALAAA